MKKKEVKINYIFTRMAHHSLHSGYDQLVKYIDDSRVVEPNYLHRFLSLLPERVLAQLRRTAGSWYNSHALKKELQNIFDFIFKSNRIYHFLYGEDGFHYSGYLNQRKTNKIIATFHMPPAKFLKITEGTQHLKKLDAVIILAPNQESLFKNIVKPEKVHLVPHGVDTKFFHPVRDIKKHEKKCLFVGTHLRNFKMLRQVIEEINRKDPEVSFTIVTFKDFFNHFEGLRNVKLCSSVSEEQLVDFYNTSELLLLPISDCTACNTVLEAMACGLPIVSTQVGGISMYVNEKSAALVNPGDISRMVERTLEIVNNQQLKLSMSREARKKAEEFDWTIIAKKTQGIYAHLLQNN
jgi:glycosyltransferase involved in cell wall biosynthesis